MTAPATTCGTCNNTRIVIVREPDRRSKANYVNIVRACPECRAHLYPLPVHDGKMAAAGGDR